MSARVRVSTDREGGLVAVKAARDDEERAALRYEAELLRRCSHPGVVAVVGPYPVGPGEGPMAGELRLRYAGEPIDRWRGDLRQTAGVLAAVAATLGDLHDMGVVHGRLDGSHVLVGDDGRPRLCGFRPSPGATPADDVAGLGHLGVDLLERMVPVEQRWPLWRRSDVADRRALAEVVGRATDDLAGRRPSARTLAASLLTAVPGAELPNATHPAPDGPRPSTPADAEPFPPEHDARVVGHLVELDRSVWPDGHPDDGDRPGPGRYQDTSGVEPFRHPAPPPPGTGGRSVRPGSRAVEPRVGPDPVVGSAGMPPGRAAIGEVDTGRPPLPHRKPRSSTTDRPGRQTDRRLMPPIPAPSRLVRPDDRAMGPGAGAGPDAGPGVDGDAHRPVVGSFPGRPRATAHPPPSGRPPATRPPAVDPVFGDQSAAEPADLFANRPWPASRPAPNRSRRPTNGRPTARRRPPPPLHRRGAVILAVALGATVVAGFLFLRAGWPAPMSQAGARAGSPGACDPLPSGSVLADVDGDGCREEVVVDAGVVEVAGRRWAVAEHDDSVAVADWDCDGVATPAVYRSDTGDVFVFPRWADESGPIEIEATGSVPGGTGIAAVEPGLACPPLAIDLRDGGRRTVAVTG